MQEFMGDISVAHESLRTAFVGDTITYMVTIA